MFTLHYTEGALVMRKHLAVMILGLICMAWCCKLLLGSECFNNGTVTKKLFCRCQGLTKLCFDADTRPTSATNTAFVRKALEVGTTCGGKIFSWPPPPLFGCNECRKNGYSNLREAARCEYVTDYIRNDDGGWTVMSSYDNFMHSSTNYSCF
jgi:hypothetical protein